MWYEFSRIKWISKGRFPPKKWRELRKLPLFPPSVTPSIFIANKPWRGVCVYVTYILRANSSFQAVLGGQSHDPSFAKAVINHQLISQCSTALFTVQTEAQILSWERTKVTNCYCYCKSLQSSLTLCDPIDGRPPGFPVPGTLQARTLEWVATSFSNA